MNRVFVVMFLLFSGIVPLCAQEMTKTSRSATKLNTVTGTIETTAIGFALTHEHLFSNFGASPAEASQYEEAALLKQVLPYLQNIKKMGVNTLFDCTAAYFGRRADLLQKIADSTGLHIITNTGFYGGANDRYVPAFAFEASTADLSKIWIAEFENGIDGTGIKPGFIKLAFDEGEPSAIDQKLFTAALLAHLRTGLTIAVHTGKNTSAAKTQLQLLHQYGVDPAAWIWVHANFVQHTAELIEAAQKGAWISLDGVKENNLTEYIDKLKLFKAEKLLHKVLLSHDGNGYPRGKEIRQFDAVMLHLIPALRQNGFTQQEIDLITVQNPGQAFGIGVKRTR
jgi:predicted metal-dependent phosphotriesterase family hydrolase